MQPFNPNNILGLNVTPPQPQICPTCKMTTSDFVSIERPLPQGNVRILFIGCYTCLEMKLRRDTERPSLEVRMALQRARNAITQPQDLREIDAVVAVIDSIIAY